MLIDWQRCHLHLEWNIQSTSAADCATFKNLCRHAVRLAGSPDCCRRLLWGQVCSWYFQRQHRRFIYLLLSEWSQCAARRACSLFLMPSWLTDWEMSSRTLRCGSYRFRKVPLCCIGPDLELSHRNSLFSFSDISFFFFFKLLFIIFIAGHLQWNTARMLFAHNHKTPQVYLCVFSYVFNFFPLTFP